MGAEQKFISAEEFDAPAAEEDQVIEFEDEEEYSEVADQCVELSKLANRGNGVSRLHVPRELERKKVVNAFHNAFDLIGGTVRLAHWADTHPTDFFKLYARMIPSEANQKITHDGEYTVRHILPPGPLDKEA